jgi:hypothetical protein
MHRHRTRGRASDTQGGIHSALAVALAVLALIALSALASLAAVALDNAPAEAVATTPEPESTITASSGSPFPTGLAVMDPTGRTGEPVLPVVATTIHTRRP